MSLLISGVLGNEVEVFSSDDDGSVHFGRYDSSAEDAASNGDHAGEGAFLICRPRMLDFSILICDRVCQIANGGIRAAGVLTDEVPINCCLRCSEAQSHVFEPSPSTLSDLLALRGLRLVVEEDVRLFLVGTLRLDCQFGRHDCGYVAVVC